MSMSNETEEIRIKPVQLLVEGNDERNFFEAFIDHLSINVQVQSFDRKNFCSKCGQTIPDIQIQNFKSKDKLRKFLPMFVVAPGFRDKVRSIGIVRDAEMQDVEKSAENAFKSVQDALKNAGLPAPDCPEKRKVDGRLAVEVLILPGGDRTKGMLETLLCQTFAGTEIDSCIDKFFQCVEPLLREPIKEHQKDKARAFAYLTTRPNPHHSVGVAAKKKDWGDLDSPVFGRVRSFLERIVVLPGVK